MNQSANCTHCQALLRSGEYDWVLTEITQESEWQLSQAEQIARVWAETPDFALGDLTLEKFQTLIADLRNFSGETEGLRTRLTAAINNTNAKVAEVTDAITRSRSGFRAAFGPDSTKYEQVGGTRRSERKRRPSGKSGGNKSGENK